MDEQQFQHYYRKWGPALASKTDYLVSNKQQAADIVQEAFLKLWQNPPHSCEPASLYSWLYRTCHNKAIDHLRRAQHQGEKHHLSTTLIDDDDHSLAQRGCSIEDRLANRQLVIKLLSRFAVRDQRILAYRYIDGLNYEELSQLLGCSLRTIKRRCSYIQQRFETLRLQHGQP